MKAEKDKKTGKWLIQYRYTDWQGKRRKSTKRGFATKREAEEWLRNFLITQKADFDMKFEDFWKIYCADMETRLREHTMRTKKYIVELKILPYFGNKRVNDITAADIRQWQNELIKMGYSPTYLKTINNQLSARSCSYSNIVVVGTKQRVQYLVEELRETQIVMKEITEQILSGDFSMSGESYKELKEDYLAFMITMVDILNGAAYLFDKKPDSDNRHWKEQQEIQEYCEALGKDISGKEKQVEKGM